MRNGSTVSTRPSTCQRVVLNSSQVHRAELKSSKILVYRPLARDSTDKLPNIVEPVSPRLRVHYVHSERSFSSVFHINLSYYCTSLHTLHPTSPASLPVSLVGSNKLQLFSATDLSLSHFINIISPPSSSPKGKSYALLPTAKYGEGYLDKGNALPQQRFHRPNRAPQRAAIRVQT